MSVINMSIMAVPLIAAIAVIRFFAVHKLPKKTFYVMWAIVLYQLFIPFNLFAQLDVPSHIADLSDKVTENTINTADTTNIIIENTSHSVLYDIFDTIDNTVNPINVNVSSLPLIWLAGFLCCAAYFIVTHLKFRRIYAQALPVDSTFVRSWKVEYSDSMRRKVKITQSELITSPITYGIFHPVILLPKTTDYNNEATLKYILLHEYTHIRRFDVLAKLLLVTALSVHWFNPFVWLMYMLANRDIELSCDETVVRKSNANTSVNIKSDYALTLLALEEKKSVSALGVNFSRNTHFARNVHFGRNVMKERIESIMKIQKKSIPRIINAGILIFIITIMFAILQSCGNVKDYKDYDDAIQIEKEPEIIELHEPTDISILESPEVIAEIFNIDTAENTMPYLIQISIDLTEYVSDDIGFTNEDTKQFYEIDWSKVSGKVKWLTYEEYIEVTEVVGLNFYVDNGIIRPFVVSPEETAKANEECEAIREGIKNGTMNIGITMNSIIGNITTFTD